MKTLRVTLADIVGPTGTPNSTATVHARYVDPSGRGRDVHLTDGTIVVPVRRTVAPGTVPQHFDFDVYANDVAPVREVDYGHLVEVSWTVVAPTGAKTSGVRRVAITDDTPGVVQLGLLATPTPVPPYTGGYSLPGHKHAVGDFTATGTPSASTYLRGDGSWSTPAGGGGGGAVDSVNGEVGVVVLDAADVGADPAGTAAGLVGALIIPDSPDDIGAATAAQGALADTAVQPADLTAYATDAELAVGLGTKANTSHGHAIADTTGLQAALDAKADDLGADDNYVTDAEKVKLANLSGTNTGDQVLPTWSTISGKPAVVAAGATQADARTAIGAGTSSFSGAYADLSGKPTLGTAAATASTDYAPAAHTTSTDHDDRYVVVVEHGAVAGTARPSGATVVLWVGTVEPANAIAGDQWDNASGAPSVYIEEPASEGTTGQVLTTDGAGGRTWTTISGGGTVVAADVDSEASTDGHVLTSDGAGGAAWEAPPAGGGSDPWTYLVATADTASGTAGATVDIAGLTVSSLSNGLYEFQAVILATAEATGVGVQTGIVTPTGCTATVLWQGPNGAPATGSSLTFAPAAIAASSYTSGYLNSSVVTSPFVAALVTGVFRASSMSGALKMTVKSDTTGAGSSVVAKTDSFMAYRLIGS